MRAFWLLLVAQKAATAVLDACVARFAGGRPPLHAVAYDVRWSDRACLACNAVVETAFVARVLHDSRALPWIGWTTAPGALLLLFVVDDLLYAPYHWLLHSKALYRHIHARHHRIRRPSRPYLHATLEHPAEMMGALLLHWGMLLALRPVLCCASVWAHVVLKAALACLNHCGRDVRLLGYRTAHHDLHHDKRTVNYSQTTFAWDRMMGTYCAAAS